MRYSITFAEDDYQSLAEHLHQPGFVERGAYLLCSPSITEFESRFLVREVIPVRSDEVISASSSHMEIAPQSFMRAMKRANMRHLSFVFVHSHPYGPACHSPQDDATEASLFRTAYTRIAGQAIHASIVSSGIDQPQGRVWHPNGSTSPIDVIRVIGNRFRFIHRIQPNNGSTEIFDRQVRAFGTEVQQLLAALHIGIVGNGGTGSAVAEQLIRLGAGRLSLLEGQTLEASNVTRVYGSRLSDVDQPKGLRVRSRFTFEGFIGTAQPSSPLRWFADIFLPFVGGRKVIISDAREFLWHLLEVNSTRVQNDVLDRIQDSRGRLDAEIRKLLHEVSNIAEQALARARTVKEDGAPAVQAVVERLNRLESDISALI